MSLHAVTTHPTLVDIQDSSQLLTDFKASLPMEELLNCADAAALLVQKFGSCGIADFGVVPYCSSLSVTMKSCATGYYRLVLLRNHHEYVF